MRQVARETRATHGGVPARRRWSLVFASVWLVYLSQPVSSILHSDRPPVVRGLGIGLTALFVAVYIGGFASAFPRVVGRIRRVRCGAPRPPCWW